MNDRENLKEIEKKLAAMEEQKYMMSQDSDEFKRHMQAIETLKMQLEIARKVAG